MLSIFILGTSRITQVLMLRHICIDKGKLFLGSLSCKGPALTVTCRCRSLIPVLSVGSLYSGQTFLKSVLIAMQLPGVSLWVLQSSLAVGLVQVTWNWTLSAKESKTFGSCLPPMTTPCQHSERLGGSSPQHLQQMWQWAQFTQS